MEQRAQERKKERDAGFTSEGENTSLEVSSPESVTSVGYDDPFTLIGECCRTVSVVHRLSPPAWVSIGGRSTSSGVLVRGSSALGRRQTQRVSSSTFLESHHSTRKCRAGSQVPSAPHPGHVGQGRSQGVQSFTIPETTSHHASAEPRTDHRLVRLVREVQRLMFHGFAVPVLSNPLILTVESDLAGRYGEPNGRAARHKESEDIGRLWLGQGTKMCSGPHDAEGSLRIQRSTKGEAANMTTYIKHSAMVFIPSEEFWVAELTYGSD